MTNAPSETPVLDTLAAGTPGDCFYAAVEAARVALTYRTPVYLLSDAYLANGTEPWRIPEIASLPKQPDVAGVQQVETAIREDTSLSCCLSASHFDGKLIPA